MTVISVSAVSADPLLTLTPKIQARYQHFPTSCWVSGSVDTGLQQEGDD